MAATDLYIWTFKTDDLEVNPDVGRGVSCRFRDCRGGGGGRAGQASRGWQCGAAALCNAQSLGLFSSMLQRLGENTCKILQAENWIIYKYSLLCHIMIYYIYIHRLHVFGSFQFHYSRVYISIYLCLILFVLSFTCDVFNNQIIICWTFVHAQILNIVL